MMPPPPPKKGGNGCLIALAVGVAATFALVTLLTIGLTLGNLTSTAQRSSNHTAHSPAASSTEKGAERADTPESGEPEETNEPSEPSSPPTVDEGSVGKKYGFTRPVSITGTGSTCLDVLNKHRDWLPGGWSFDCVPDLDDDVKPSDLPPNSMTLGRTQATYDNVTREYSGTISIRNTLERGDVERTLAHELGHAYAYLYMTKEARQDFARSVGKEKFYYPNSVEYVRSPTEIWARSFGQCMTGLKDSDNLPTVSCSEVDKYVARTENEFYLDFGLVIDLDYRLDRAPEKLMNGRRSSS